MKYLLTIMLVLIVLTSIAQTGQPQSSRTPHQVSLANNSPGKLYKTAVQDTVFTIRLTLGQMKALFSSLQAAAELFPRSFDLTALQANEAQKQLYSIGKLINDQLPKSPSDSLNKNR